MGEFNMEIIETIDTLIRLVPDRELLLLVIDSNELTKTRVNIEISRRAWERQWSKYIENAQSTTKLN